MKRLLLAVLLCAATARGAELRVSAAASLTDVLRELGAAYERRTGTEVVFNFGASSTLATQIVHGAPADVFVSADERQMDRVATMTRRKLLSNVLVVVVPAGSRVDWMKARRIAIANPQTVPAGVYAKQWLTSRGLWTKLAPRMIPTDNVRAALAAVEAGHADAGIVYRTDAKISPRVRIALVVEDGPAISYPGAVLKGAASPKEAARFLDFLASPAAKAVFRRHGFVV
ncbi:MAG TPA: molybdate ABC transporter substrate-binding protein [Thermoanaerobaculia bacterium]|nr:molybdate ABC transporter substrate-binding protein [Thermoanaerobaculia bacterium]